MVDGRGLEGAAEAAADLAKRLTGMVLELRQEAQMAALLADMLQRLRVPEQALPYIDVVEEIPVNARPTTPREWWMRMPEQIKGITIHHTLSHSPAATARYVIGIKGRPTLPYHFWVTREGRALLCVPLENGMWHDHTGHKNVNISVGMAGKLHVAKPNLAQLEATTRLCVWLMHRFGIGMDQVQGHKDRFRRTVCPGWDKARWRAEFYESLATMAADLSTDLSTD